MLKTSVFKLQDLPRKADIQFLSLDTMQIRMYAKSGSSTALITGLIVDDQIILTAE
jgi:hypothetical protein